MPGKNECHSTTHKYGAWKGQNVCWARWVLSIEYSCHDDNGVSAEYNDCVPYKWTKLCHSESWIDPWHSCRTEKEMASVGKGQTLTPGSTCGEFLSFCCQNAGCSRCYYACSKEALFKPLSRVVKRDCLPDLTGSARAVEAKKPCQLLGPLCLSRSLFFPWLSSFPSQAHGDVVFVLGQEKKQL